MIWRHGVSADPADTSRNVAKGRVVCCQWPDHAVAVGAAPGAVVYCGEGLERFVPAEILTAAVRVMAGLVRPAVADLHGIEVFGEKAAEPRPR